VLRSYTASLLELHEAITAAAAKGEAGAADPDTLAAIVELVRVDPEVRARVIAEVST
jgi:hypothetical protein